MGTENIINLLHNKVFGVFVRSIHLYTSEGHEGIFLKRTITLYIKMLTVMC